jgi:hypothetical protein
MVYSAASIEATGRHCRLMQLRRNAKIYKDKQMKNRSDKPKNKKSNQILRMRGLSVGDVVLPWESGDVVLPWESKEQFRRLHRELTAELSPQGRMQEDIAFEVAILRWRKYRVLKMLRTAALKDTFFVELMESGKKSWSGIRKYLLEQDQDCKTIRGKLTDVVSKLAEAAEKELAHDQKGMENQEFESRQQRVSDITKSMTEHLIPLLQYIDAGPTAEKTFEQAYSPEFLERILKCEAAIDARIDKLLARLVSLKEYQRLYGAKAVLPPMIESPPTAGQLMKLITDR